MKCERCGESFDREATKKTIKGRQHIFCSEMCYRFYHYRVPEHDTKRIFGSGSNTVRITGVPDFRVLVAEDEESRKRNGNS